MNWNNTSNFLDCVTKHKFGDMEIILVNKKRIKPPLALRELTDILRAKKIFSHDDYLRYMRARCNDDYDEPVGDLIFRLMMDTYDNCTQGEICH